MKHIVTFIALCLTITVTAQKGLHRDRASLNPEQQATLSTKKMTLALVLDTQQADKIYKIQLEQAKKRKVFIENRKKEKGTELTKEQRFELKNKRLDAMIVVQGEMKQILNEEQFKKWQRLVHKRKQTRKKKHHRRK